MLIEEAKRLDDLITPTSHANPTGTSGPSTTATVDPVSSDIGLSRRRTSLKPSDIHPLAPAPAVATQLVEWMYDWWDEPRPASINAINESIPEPSRASLRGAVRHLDVTMHGGPPQLLACCSVQELSWVLR